MACPPMPCPNNTTPSNAKNSIIMNSIANDMKKTIPAIISIQNSITAMLYTPICVLCGLW